MSKVRQRKRVISSTKHEQPEDHDTVRNGGWNVFFKVAIFVFIILPGACLLGVILLVTSPVDPAQPTESWPEPPKLEGPLAMNDLLVFQGERLFEQQLIGPEAIVHKSGHLYTGTADGKILHIDLSTKTIDTIATLGTPPCGKLEDEPHCGRPLGMRFDKDGYLIVADAYLGIYKINVASRDVFQLLSGDTEVNGQQLKFFNDLDIASDGTIYFTDSTHFRRREFILDLLEGSGNGRLFKFNPGENKTEVLCRNIHFANGVQLSKDESHILVSESAKARILKYHLSGAKRGLVETFAENLPGYPDNIRRSSSGGYWVAMSVCRYAERLNLMEAFYYYPWIRKQLAKLPVKLFSFIIPRCGLVVELDKQGKIIRSLQDLKGERFYHVSQVEEDAGYLYLGSFIAPFIGKVNTFKKTAER